MHWKKPKGISLDCKAYPNPATDFLMLKVEDPGDKNLTYQLFDINGKLLADKKVESNETTIFMGNLAAIYLLKVTQNG